MLNWLVIGIGDITRKRVIPAIETEPRSRLHAVLTRDPRKAESYAGASVYTELNAALKDDSIDAVYVASPVVLHSEQTIACLRAGKQVLCEKPVAIDYAQAKSMAEAARQTGKLLGIAYFRRGFPKLMRAKELVAEGAIGQPIFAQATYHGWLESEERAWLRDPAVAGGGPLFDVGSHRIDACNLLFGEPKRAMGMLSNTLHDLKVEDSATVLIEYAGGVHAEVDARWNSRVGRDEFRIFGVEGEIDLTPMGGPTLRVKTADGKVREEQLPQHANVHYPVVENFVSAVLDGKPLMCPIDEAIQTDWVTEQVMRAR
jgi:1,5-anhydro-D-fructose reductase (1,5-anhydro-D-mannitol-forming)